MQDKFLHIFLKNIYFYVGIFALTDL